MDKKFAIILFVVSFCSLCEIWFMLHATVLIFGRETTGQITSIDVTKIDLVDSHISVHTQISFQTLDGTKINTEFVSGNQVFSTGAIKVKYDSSDPHNYIFTDLNSSYFKFFLQDLDGLIIGLLVLSSICLISLIGGLKALGYDLISKLKTT